MVSHKSESGRIPRLKDLAYQSRNAPLPVINASTRVSSSSISISSALRIARPTNIKTGSNKGSSFSDADLRHPVAPSKPSGILSTHNARSLLPPRAATHPLPSVAHSTPSVLNTERGPPPRVNTETPSNSLAQQPIRGKPRNVLRRKAPTIGQHTGNNKSTTEGIKTEKLNVMIPDTIHPGQAMGGSSPPRKSQTGSIEETVSSYTPQDTTVGRPPEQQVHNGPKELASLRTTLNTQNLPPPTPIFASASSPSTRYSGSPGMWSRTSTPTSLSSYSPGIVQPVKAVPRIRQPSPSQTRLPVSSRGVQQTSQDHSVHPRANKSPGSVPEPSATSSCKRRSQDFAAKGLIADTSTVSDSLFSRKAVAKSCLPRKTQEKADTESGSVSQENSQAIRPHESTESNATYIPARPSREGTDRLQVEPSPVVRSNLSPDIVSSHNRRPSKESSFTSERLALGSVKSASTSVDSLQSRSSSQLPSRLSPELSRKSPRASTRETEARQTPQTPASPSKIRRFGLFTKRSKPELEAKSSEGGRATRKGPSAGTGHEGYGKYAQRGRRASATSSGSRARSTSTVRSASRSVSSKGSMNSRPDMELDDFLLDRLEPVFINGGGVDGATLARTQSEQSSSGLSTSSVTSLSQKAAAPKSYGYSTESLTSSTDTIGKFKSLSRETKPENNVLAAPASIHQPKILNAENLEKPISSSNVDSERPMPVPQVRTISSGQSRPGARGSPNSVKTNGATNQSNKSPKKGLGLKWNFFQKSHDTKHAESETPLPPPHRVQAKVSLAAAAHRPIAHYALVDADTESLNDIIRNVQDSPPTEEEKPDTPVEIPAALNIRKPSESILLPSPPKLNSEFKASTKVFFNKDQVPPSSPNLAEPMEEQRPTRLASVGRIPRVVSRRDRQHRPALQSFSRPFSMADSPSIAAPVATTLSDFSPPGLPALEAQSGVYHGNPSGFGFDFTQPFGDPMSRSVLDFIAGPYSSDQFLTFYPRKESTTTITSSSGSESLAAVTAVIPEPESALTEDEVWGEYDDLIDHVLSPETARPLCPGNSAADEKFELAAMASRALQAELSGFSDLQAFPTAVENPAVALTPASPTSSSGSFHLRRSKIAPTLHSSLVPSSQPSFSDIIACYHNDGSVENLHEENLNNLSTPSLSIEQQSSFLTSPSLNPSPSFETCRQRNTILFDIAERDREGPTAQTNIRSGSLMTSRWLSFGRVLFSPAHNHIKNGEEERILVVDGLGNDDWSFYCALTYPNAEVYNLNDAPTPTGSKHPDAWQPPSNHHTIHHANLEYRFPFPKRYFTVAVLRFPAACSEHVQDNIISECKRVLRPGGYMEMSLLDLDMVNMGIRTRKAVRNLKERTYLTDPSISLKPSSDSIQRLLGRHGFDNLRRCIVRIPVAGVIVRSSASSSSTSSSNPSTLAVTATSSTALSHPSNSSIGAQTKAHSKSSSNDTDLSLGDLLSDPSPSPSNDESIRKIVARVGRWWYTRCYEIPVLANGDAGLSIWSDRKVLRECQKRGTGFRLLTAYAQKPSEKRRTASV
ncbi:hypothetical protein BDV32DRAFT_83883 [Aspergillus pseudonomiae]|uniref:Uncharacterized protein n=1 Tax=Aspergillus pseudonomiae TaxID=1506151 RepID=A0A5N6IDQ5_9EURO|nr:uncharacterized protein BDV37DRAFT_110575 [Aspergillus pseudonomiae]KAB8264414.1 hypothetical protein BDV32DRAFT_83883 [Aspergillus pseudonomiae]KAE8409266.1 hypothetical protein BDV37DRAFT_110575 [Aspergillus pseudonomiae]